METREIARIVAIEFAHFLTTKCFYNIKGYMLYDEFGVDKMENTKFEYQVDELYDYWIEQIYLPSITK